MKGKIAFLILAVGFCAVSCKKSDDDQNPPRNPNPTGTWTITENTLQLDGLPFNINSEDVFVNNNISGVMQAGEDQYSNPSARKPKISLYSPSSNQFFQEGLSIGKDEFRTEMNWDFQLSPVDLQGDAAPIMLSSFVNEFIQGNIFISDMNESQTSAYGVDMIEFQFNDLLVSDMMMAQGTGTQGTNTQGTPTLGMFKGMLRIELK